VDNFFKELGHPIQLGVSGIPNGPPMHSMLICTHPEVGARWRNDECCSRHSAMMTASNSRTSHLWQLVRCRSAPVMLQMEIENVNEMNGELGGRNVQQQSRK